MTDNGDKLVFNDNEYYAFIAGNDRVYVLLEQPLCEIRPRLAATRLSS